LKDVIVGDFVVTVKVQTTNIKAGAHLDFQFFTGDSTMRKFASVLMLLGVPGLALVEARADTNQWPWTDVGAPACGSPAGTKIGYVQPNATLLPVKPVQGKTYDDLVPDTTDIAEMSRLAINVLTCGTNPLQDHEQYFSVNMGNPVPGYVEWNVALDPLAIACLLRKTPGRNGISCHFNLLSTPWY
jgi:hypothetical protein